MGVIKPETCWAVYVRQNNKILRLIVASSWVFYLSDWRCTEPQTLNSILTVHCIIELKCGFVGPNNPVHKFCIMEYVFLKLLKKMYPLSYSRHVTLWKEKFEHRSFQKAMYHCMLISVWRPHRVRFIYLFIWRSINLLNAELKSICHLLMLLGDLTFMGPCIVSIFQYIANKTQSYTVYLCLETALHVSGGTSTHHQERIQLYLLHLPFVTPLLLSPSLPW
jgi:hypothetical protein